MSQELDNLLKEGQARLGKRRAEEERVEKEMEARGHREWQEKWSPILDLVVGALPKVLEEYIVLPERNETPKGRLTIVSIRIPEFAPIFAKCSWDNQLKPAAWRLHGYCVPATRPQDDAVWQDALVPHFQDVDILPVLAAARDYYQEYHRAALEVERKKNFAIPSMRWGEPIREEQYANHISALVRLACPELFGE